MQGDAAFGRHRRLSHQQGGQQRVPDAFGDLLGSGPVHPDCFAEVVERLSVQAEFEQSEQDVHAVGVFVVLGA